MKHRDHAVLLTPPLRNNRSVQASTKTEKAQPDTGAPSRARHTGKTHSHLAWRVLLAGGRLIFLPQERENLICFQRPWRQAWEIREEMRVWEAGGGVRAFHWGHQQGRLLE